MHFFGFTPQEIKALLFLLTALLIGSGITIYKRQHSDFAPELVCGRSSLNSLEEERQSGEAFKDTSYRISESSSASPIQDLATQRPRPQDRRRSETPGFGISSAQQNPLTGKIDLNSASASELELLPHIGPVLSQRIVNYRKTKGKFQRIEDLMNVSGIGPKTFERIKDFVTVE
jgi:competence ComEA-like helix-hairpin-helix protein